MDHSSSYGMAGMSGMSNMTGTSGGGMGTSTGGMSNTSSGGMSNTSSGGMNTMPNSGGTGNMSSSGGMGHMAGMGGMSGHSDGSMMSTSFVASIPTVPLWFSGWQPSTAGGTFGACVGLFGLAVLARLLGAIRHQAGVAWMGARWAPHAAAAGGSHTTLEKADSSPQMAGTRRNVGRWNVAQDVPRGLLGTVHTGIEYFLMLAVMTFNGYFFIAILVGVFVGETCFGRWSSGGGSGHGGHG